MEFCSAEKKDEIESKLVRPAHRKMHQSGVVLDMFRLEEKYKDMQDYEAMDSLI